MRPFKKVSSCLSLMIFGSGLILGIHFLFNFKPNPAGAIINSSTTVNSNPEIKNVIESFQQICEIYKDEKNGKNYLREQAMQESDQKSYETPIKSLEVFCENHEFKNLSTDQILRIADHLGWIAYLYHLNSDYNKAIEFNENRINIIEFEINKISSVPSNSSIDIDYKSIELKQQKISALNRLGNANYLMGNYARSRIYYDDALHFNEQNELAINEAIKSKNYNKKIAELIKTTKKDEAIINGDLGSIYHSIGQYDLAIFYHNKRLKSLNELIKEKNINNNIRLHIDAGEKQEILNLKAAAYGSLGNAHYSQYLYNKTNQSSLQNNRFKNYHREICKSKLFSKFSNQLIDYHLAVCYFERRLAIAINTEDKRGEAIALGELAMTSQEARIINKSSKKNLCLQCAINYYDKRLKIVESKGFNDKRLIASTYGGLAYIYQAQEQYKQAIEYAEKYLKISDNRGDNPGVGNAKNLLGVLYFQRSQTKQSQPEDVDNSIKYLNEAMEIKEEIGEQLVDVEQIFLNDTQEYRNVYFNLQEVYVNQQQDKKALEIAERGRARALAQNLVNQLNSSPKKAELLTIDQIWTIANQQQATLIVYSIIPNPIIGDKPLLYTWVIEPGSKQSIQFKKSDLDIEVIFKKLQIKIPKFNIKINIKTELNDIGRGHLHIGIVGGPRIFRGDKFNNSKTQIDTKYAQRIFYAYYKLLIEPINKELAFEPNSKLIFIPQQELFQIPFAALYDQEKKQYLVEQHPILTAPSIQVLNLIQQRKKNRNRTPNQPTPIILGINAGFPGDFCNQKLEFDGLKEAEKESEDIAKLFGWKSENYSPTESHIKSLMGNARIIHFATHGILNSCEEKEAIPGVLALKKDGNEDGWLTAHEIAYSKLQAELMVLSACDTGLGRLTADGVLGLSWASIVGGSSSTIVSLWRINDEATAHLMIEFYKQLKNKPINQYSSKTLDLAEALRKAMIETKKDPKFSNPYDWSAFTLIGESTIDAEIFHKSK